jgi:transglutaminase-like putative cysteine protease
VKLLVTARLPYELETPTDFVFQLHAAKTAGQSLANERFSISTNPQITVFDAPVSENRVARCTLAAGAATVDYEAEVDVAPSLHDPASVQEFDFSELPSETLTYLLPSRYCPADLFTELAQEQFGGMDRGYGRAAAIADWVFSNLEYESGSTGPHSTSADVFQQRKGVCRDFGHLMISVARAAGIPARYLSVYADALSPQDFHVIVELYLRGPHGGGWYRFDPTRMSSVDAVARIATGRDAADVAFAWTQGNADATKPEIRVSAPERNDTALTTQAVTAGA